MLNINPLPVALQLWTVKDALAHDPAAALTEVRRIGYTAVELAGFAGIRASAMRQALDTAGVRAISAHVPFDDLTERLPAVMANLQAINCPQAVLPWIPPEQRTTMEAVLRLAEQCNAVAAQLSQGGIAFAYHNEDYDFLPLGESTLWHTLVANTNPQIVMLQLDVATATLAGCDIPSILRTYGSRITSLHVCDIREGAYAPIGTGSLDWPSLLQAVHTAAVQYLIVEQDGAVDPFAASAQSLAAITTLQST